MTDEELLQEARDKFQLAYDNESENRKMALEDLRFSRLSEQWDQKDLQDRARSRRPCLTINKLPSFIRQVVNEARQNKPEIKIHAIDSQADRETAKIFSGLIKSIEAHSSADVAYDTAIENSVSCGFGYWRVNIDYAYDDSFDLEIFIERIPNVFSVYADPHSMSVDGADWNCCFVVERLSKSEFERKYKGAEPVDWDVSGYSGLSYPWMQDDQVMVAEYWVRREVSKDILLLSDGRVIDGLMWEQSSELLLASGITVVDQRTSMSHEVTQYIMSGAEVLETNEWPGKYIPIVPVYGDEVIVENKRYFRSLIRDAKDPQRIYNYWRSASTELVALAPKSPFIGRKGQFNSDIDKWLTANSESHAFIEYDGTPGEPPPQRQPFAGPPAGAIQEALNANDDIKAVMGIYDASLGIRSNETSGVAITARQRESDTSTFHYLDNLSRAIRHTGRILVDLIPKIYTPPRVVRVLGDSGAEELVQLGQQNPEALNMAQQLQNEQNQNISRIYDLGIGRYDVTVASGPSFATLRERSAEQMIELIRAYPPAAGVIGDLLVRNLDWTESEEIEERLKSLLPQHMQGQDNPMIAQLTSQIQQLGQQLQQLQQDKSIDAQKVSIDMQKVMIDAYEAETKRLQVMGPAMNPQQIQALVIQTVQNLLSSPDISPVQQSGVNNGQSGI